MDNVLITAGIACLIAAIVGGGLKAFGIEIPQLASLRRQVLLGALGAGLLSLGFIDRLPSSLLSNVNSVSSEDANVLQACDSNLVDDLADRRRRIMAWVRAHDRTAVELQGLARLMSISTEGRASELVDRIEDKLATDYCTNSGLETLIDNARQLPWGSRI